MFETYQIVDFKSTSAGRCKKIRFNCNISCECLSIGETLVLFDNNKMKEKYEFLVTSKLRRILYWMPISNFEGLKFRKS